MLQQLGDPGAVLHIRLAPGDLGDMGGIGEHAGEGLFQHVEDWLPVDPGALHGDLGDRLGLEPIPQRQELGRGGAEGAHLLDARAIWPRDAHARHDRLLMNIQSTAPLDHLFHRRASMRDVADARRRIPITTLLDGLDGTMAGSRTLPRRFLIGHAVPLVLDVSERGARP